MLSIPFSYKLRKCPYRKSSDSLFFTKFKIMKDQLTVVLLAIALTCPFFGNAQMSEPNRIDMANWMKQLNPLIGSWKLGQIAMPGTHDSNMFRGTKKDWGRNQSLDIVGQLNAGARYFDFRIGYIYNNCAEYPGSREDPRLDSGSAGPQCWECPNGTTRTLDAVTSSTACIRKGGETFKAAIRRNRATGFFRTDCPSGQVIGTDGYCYSRPSGYSWTLSIPPHSRATVKRTRDQFHSADYQGPALKPALPTNFISNMLVPQAVTWFNDNLSTNFEPVPGKEHIIVMLTGEFVGSPDWYLRGHSQFYVGVKVTDALRDIKNWLYKHPNEVVILNIEPLDNRLNKGSFDHLFTSTLGHSIIYDDTVKPALAPLNSVKGKVILLNKENSTKDYLWNAKSNYAYGGYQGNGYADVGLYKVYMESEIERVEARDKTQLFELKSCLTPFGQGQSGIDAAAYDLESKWNPQHSALLRGDWRGKDLNIVSVDFIGEFSNIAELIVRLNFYKNGSGQ